MRPKLQLDELNKALLIACGVCYLLSFVLNKYAGAVTVFRLLFAAAAVFLGIRLFSKDPAKRNNENMKFLAGQMEAPVAGVSDLPIPHLPPVLPAASGPPGQGQDPGHLHQMPQSVHCQKLKTGVYYKQQRKGDTTMKQVTKDMNIREMVMMDEGIAEILMGAGMHCLGCMMSHFENLEQACAVHGIDADALVDQINEYLEAQGE